MIVKILKDTVAGGAVVMAGSVIEVPETEGRYLVKIKKAELAKAPKTKKQNAMKSVPEKRRLR